MNGLERNMDLMQEVTGTRATFTGIIRSFETEDQQYALGEIELLGDGKVNFEIIGSLTPHVYERAHQAFSNKETITAQGMLLQKGTEREPTLESSGQVRIETEPYIEIDRIS